MKPNKAKDIRLKALKLLARREHSRQELQNKLIRGGAEAAQVEVVLQQLMVENLLSDERFRDSYIHYRRGAGFGPCRIQAELSERGVFSNIEEALQNSGSWEGLLEQTWQKKFKGQWPQDMRTKAKQIRFLLNRGFALEQIQKFISGKPRVQDREYSEWEKI